MGLDATVRDYAVAEFASLWDSINAARAPWASNPFVWVVSFRLATNAKTAPKL
jgi:hypothetical protein